MFAKWKGTQMREIYQDNKGGTIEFNVVELYGTCSEGFDFECSTYREAVAKMFKWGYRKVGVE